MGARDHTLIRRRMAAILWAEAIGAALLPAAGLMLLYTVLVVFGLGNAWLFTVVLLAALAVTGLAGAKLRAPDGARLNRRIEAAAGLRHRPLAVLDDAPATDDPLALELWAAHRRRAAGAVAAARTGFFAPALAARDKLALRGALLLLLAAGLVAAGADGPRRLVAGFALPAWPFAGPSVTAWITPPDYAAAPPLVLTPGAQVSALAGSKVTVIVNGPHAIPVLSLPGGVFSVSALSVKSHRADAVLRASGRLRVGPWWHRLASWRIFVTAPVAPAVALQGLSVAGSKILLRWHVDDPYGLAGFAADFTMPGDDQALPLTMQLPAASGDGKAVLDLADSPLHDLPMRLTLRAENLAGVAAAPVSPALVAVPGLALHNRAAIALDRLRQRLALAPAPALGVALALQRVASAPPDRISDAADVQLAVLAQAMLLGEAGAAGAGNRLLALIKQIEAGPDYAAARALAQSNAALVQALQRGLNGNQPSAAALQTLLRAMDAALAAHLAALQAGAPGAPGQQSLDLSALDRLAARIAADEAAGRIAQAAQELQQLQGALSALAGASPMSPAQAAQAEAAARAAQGLGQLVNGEAGLLNETSQGAATAAEQITLVRGLADLRQGLRGQGMDLPGLNGAGQAMGQAQGALQAQQFDAAAAAETTAIQALQQAAAALRKAGQKNLLIGQGVAPGQPPHGNAANGLPDENSIPGFGLPAANPAGDIQQLIIKRDADPGLPAATHDYYRRLLKSE